MDMPAIARFRVRVDDDRGMSLVELLVSMFILSIVLLVFGSVLASVQRGIVRQDNLTRTLDQARLALQQLDREIRSGNVLYDPAAEGGSQATCTGCVGYYTLRIYTPANADTTSTYYCTIWKIDASGNLMTRQWPPDQIGNVTPWRTVATGLVNRTLSETAFQLDADPLKGSRTLNITLAVNNDYTHFPSQTVRVQAALTGRNTSYGFPTGICSTTPSG